MKLRITLMQESGFCRGHTTKFQAFFRKTTQESSNEVMSINLAPVIQAMRLMNATTPPKIIPNENIQTWRIPNLFNMGAWYCSLMFVPKWFLLLTSATLSMATVVRCIRHGGCVGGGNRSSQPELHSWPWSFVRSTRAGLAHCAWTYAKLPETVSWIRGNSTLAQGFVASPKGAASAAYGALLASSLQGLFAPRSCAMEVGNRVENDSHQVPTWVFGRSCWKSCCFPCVGSNISYFHLFPFRSDLASFISMAGECGCTFRFVSSLDVFYDIGSGCFLCFWLGCISLQDGQHKQR